MRVKSVKQKKTVLISQIGQQNKLLCVFGVFLKFRKMI